MFGLSGKVAIITGAIHNNAAATGPGRYARPPHWGPTRTHIGTAR